MRTERLWHVPVTSCVPVPLKQAGERYIHIVLTENLGGNAEIVGKLGRLAACYAGSGREFNEFRSVRGRGYCCRK